MGPRRKLAAAASLLALGLAGAAGAGANQQPGGARQAATSVAGTWVGVVRVSYTRFYPREDGAKESTEAQLVVLSRPNGRGRGQARKRIRNEYPGSCTSVYEEIGSYSGAMRPPDVSIGGGRYTVSYENLGIEATIRESCPEQPARSAQVSLLPVYVPIEGTARRRATRITGSLRVDKRYCKALACQETESASWDLHLVERGEGSPSHPGRAGRNGRGPRGGGPAPGEGCAKRVLAGTEGANRLLGSGRAELILGLAGDDTALGRGGADCLWGGEGDDRVLGGPGNDLLAGDGGRDEMIGGRGSDQLRARDGVAEKVRCGPGHDLAIVDSDDRALGCEAVRRPRRS